MKFLKLILLIFSLVASNLALKQSNFPYPVDPFIGTEGIGYGFGGMSPGPMSPFAGARISANTQNLLSIWLEGYDHNGGYNYPENHINSFSHTHTNGAGVIDSGWIGIMPVTARKEYLENDLKRMLIDDITGYKSKFSHDNEIAQPGYYQVYLETHQLNVEMTSTRHAGIHRYTWDESVSQQSKVILFQSSYYLGIGQIGSKNECKDSQVTIDVENKAVYGYMYSEGALSSRIGGVKIYFYSQFENDAQLMNYGIWNKQRITEGLDTIQGCDTGAYVEINNPEVTVYVGISYISIDQAKTNLMMQTNNLQPFDSVRMSTQTEWIELLQKFQITTQNNDDKIKFYTNLYHSLTAPTTWSEENGQYLGWDGKVHTKPDSMDAVYTDLSLWDVHRTDFPLLLLHDPKRMEDISNSILLIYQQGGDLPKWPWKNGYGSCMFGSPANIVLADQIVKNEISYLNESLALEASLHVANDFQQHSGRWDPITYKKLGFVPYESDTTGAVQTLAYAYDDWCIANIANKLGEKDIANDFYNRSQFYKNVWSPHEQFFCPKYETNGSFNCPLIFINPFDDRYIEGDAWHYRFNVPQDPEGLIQLFGSTENFIDQLNIFFAKSQQVHIDNSLPNPYYWSGNEEDLFAVWMFAYAGRPDLCQKYSNYIINNEYTTKPSGLPGNDDYGAISAWYVLTAIGIYPRSGSTQYILGKPIFDEITIQRQNIKKETCYLTILAYNTTAQNLVAGSYLLNGKEFTEPFLDHITDIPCNSGETITLEFKMMNENEFLNKKTKNSNITKNFLFK